MFTPIDRVFTILIFLAVSNMNIQNAIADGCDQDARDDSTVISEGTLASCGNTAWDLSATFEGTTYDEGEYDATGVCYGDYTNCNCSYVGLSFQNPGKSFDTSDLDEGGGEYNVQWHWTILNYTNTHLNSCSSGPCQSTGYVSDTATYYVDENAGSDSTEYSCDD